MARYEIVFKRSVYKDLKPIPKADVKRILKRIDALSDDPRGPGWEKLSGQERYRVRQGVYRIVYEIADERLVVTVVKIGHRGKVYDPCDNLNLVHETFVHLDNSIDDLNDARDTLVAVLDAEKGRLSRGAYKYGLIAYCRPFTNSKGPEKLLSLTNECVPGELLGLHKRILELRHKILAHTDSDIQNNELHLDDIGGRRHVAISSNILDSTELYSRVDEIIALIELELYFLLKRREEVKKSL